MTKAWESVKDELEREIDLITWEEPAEVSLSRAGFYPSGAGTGGQYFANLLFQLCETQAMSWANVTPAVSRAINDDEFSLEACKRMWSYLVVVKARLLGEMAPPNCPAPWLNLERLSNLAIAVDDALVSVETKDELKDLLWSWNNYVERLTRWFFLVFPWEISQSFIRQPVGLVQN